MATKNLIGRSSKLKDETGKPYDKLTVREYVGSDKRGRAQWLCHCECGREVVVLGSSLRSGNTSACRFCRAVTHGNTRGVRVSPEYVSWNGMMTRCTSENNSEYKNYGGRGIRVCERWQLFANFLADMGPKPSREHSIDRYPNGDGNYEPGNCRWATPQQQSDNRRTNRLLTLNGETMNITQWARRLGIRACTLHYRIAHGWSLERALTSPKNF